MLIEEDYKDVLDFWFSSAVQAKWFDKDKDFDCLIEKKFLNLYLQAASGNLSHWTQDPDSSLALIIILDQFPRNMFRNSPKSFQTDSIALKLSKEAISKGLDKKVDVSRRGFFYMPLMHSEVLSDQKLCMELFKDNPAQYSYAMKHMEIIEKFGRFPHRNTILGRESNDEELLFLTKPNSSF